MDVAHELIAETRAFGDLFAVGDPHAPVPTCGDWNLTQLFRHVGRGNRWSAHIVATRASEPIDPRSVPDGKPPEDLPGAVAWLNDGAQLILDAVAATGAEAPVWTFLGPRPAAWWIRRRLHEVLVHRADAALAIGVPFEVSPEMAADAMSEWLDLAVLMNHPDLGGATVHLHATDVAGGEWTIGPDGWTAAHGKGDVALRGPAAELLLALTRRRGVGDTSVTVFGDGTLWQRWLDATPF